jgi:hypothetical protein
MELSGQFFQRIGKKQGIWRHQCVTKPSISVAFMRGRRAVPARHIPAIGRLLVYR